MSNQVDKFHLCYVLYYSSLRIDFGVTLPNNGKDALCPEHVLNLKNKAIETARLLQRSPYYDVCQALLYPVYEMGGDHDWFDSVLQISPGKDVFSLPLKPSKDCLVGIVDSRFCLSAYKERSDLGWSKPSADKNHRVWLFLFDGSVVSGRGTGVFQSDRYADVGVLYEDKKVDHCTADPTATTKWSFINNEWRLLPEFENTEG